MQTLYGPRITAAKELIMHVSATTVAAVRTAASDKRAMLQAVRNARRS
jgi:hypothetical protein